MNEITVLLRLLVAAGLGAIVGYERERAHKIAGLRTHALVSLGAALFAIISTNAFSEYLGKTTYDPSRVVSNIVVGIGFIGAGAVLKQGKIVTGTTTAATLWIVGAIGAAVGLGMIFPAVFAAAIAYAILIVLTLIVKRVHSEERHHIPIHGEYLEEGIEEKEKGHQD